MSTDPFTFELEEIDASEANCIPILILIGVALILYGSAS